MTRRRSRRTVLPPRVRRESNRTHGVPYQKGFKPRTKNPMVAKEVVMGEVNPPTHVSEEHRFVQATPVHITPIAPPKPKSVPCCVCWRKGV